VTVPPRFCTYFDSNYLLRGVAMYRSLKRHAPDAELWVLCLDGAVRAELERAGLDGMRLVPLEELEAADPELAAARRDRSLVEYYFTCTASWCRYVMARAQPGEVVVFVDADLLFFRSAVEAIAELGAGSILIVPHRFPPESSLSAKFGEFNVGLIAFTNDANAQACVRTWRSQCLEWCRDVPDGARYADQKYLDAWPRQFSGVRVSQRPGIGLAPWNWAGHELTLDGSQILVDGEAVVFFHFHGLTLFSSWLYDSGTREYGVAGGRAEKALYGTYLRELRESTLLLQGRGVNVRLRDRVLGRRRRSLAAILRKLCRARIDWSHLRRHRGEAAPELSARS
jgi:hypothetical protein